MDREYYKEKYKGLRTPEVGEIYRYFNSELVRVDAIKKHSNGGISINFTCIQRTPIKKLSWFLDDFMDGTMVLLKGYNTPLDRFFQICGWLGGFLLAWCAVPEVYLALKTGDSALSWTFLAMWGGGEISLLIPVLFKIKEKYLILNYLLNVVFIGIICLCKYF